jgi:hypothetical protein
VSEMGPFWLLLAWGECGACSRTEVQWCFLVSGHHYSPFPAAPSLRSSEARTGLLAFRKIDLDVYRSRGLYAPGAMREVALAKVGHLQLDPAAPHGFLERSVKVSEALNGFATSYRPDARRIHC